MTESLRCGHSKRFSIMGAKNGCLACQCEEAQAIVDKLRKTADDVPAL